MRIGTFLEMARNGRLTASPRIARTLFQSYRLAFIKAGFESGILRAIDGGEGSLEQLVERFAHGRRDPLEAWLDVGVAVGELRRTSDGYSIRGALSRVLLEPENDDLLALMTEASTLHLDLIDETPGRLEEGRLFTLDDQDGELVARSSETIAPLVHEAVARLIPKQGPFRLLEIGCGAGAHVRYASSINAELETTALELQEAVASRASKNLEHWGLTERAEVILCDVRDREAEPEFDAATLHNNIYYFPVAERVTLLEHVRGFLKPGGRVLLTTGCTGGSPLLEVLNLWGAATEGCGRLPERGELLEQLSEAGYIDTRAVKITPGEAYYAFFGTSPA